MNFDNIEVEINPDYTMMKRINDALYLSQEQIDILEEFNIDYRQFHKLSDLILAIEEIYDSTGDEVLNNLLDILSERDYYENYNK